MTQNDVTASRVAQKKVNPRKTIALVARSIVNIQIFAVSFCKTALRESSAHLVVFHKVRDHRAYRIDVVGRSSLKDVFCPNQPLDQTHVEPVTVRCACFRHPQSHLRKVRLLSRNRVTKSHDVAERCAQCSLLDVWRELNGFERTSSGLRLIRAGPRPRPAGAGFVPDPLLASSRTR